MQSVIPRTQLKINKQAETAPQAQGPAVAPVARSQQTLHQFVNTAANIVANNLVCLGI